METKQNLDEQIERALQSMDSHTRANPGPFLMTRINARLASRKTLTNWDRIYSIITRPVIAFAAVVCILIVNLLMITSYADNDNVRLQADSNNEWQSYSTATNSALYDVENNLEP